MDDLNARATRFLQQRFPRAGVYSGRVNLLDPTTGIVEKPIDIMIAHDPAAALTQVLVSIANLGSHGEQDDLIQRLTERIDTLKSEVRVQYDNAVRPTGQPVSTDQMVDSPKTIVYTDILHCRYEDAVAALSKSGKLIELINEAEMHSSVFISYGGPDERIATAINEYLRANTVKTWFFAVDALPGQKLHRVMSDGVASHDRVLLICSRASLERSGVLNELERVLEREAREGGAEIIIPISIDDYVFKDWAPARSDIANQIRSRVITTVPTTIGSPEFNDSLQKVLAALKKQPQN